MLDTILPKPVQLIKPISSQLPMSKLDFMRDFKNSLRRILYYIEDRKLLELLKIILMEIIIPRLGRDKKIRRKRRIYRKRKENY